MTRDERVVTEAMIEAAMRSYAEAAYTEGWKTAMKALSDPESVSSLHGQEWFERNPPITAMHKDLLTALAMRSAEPTAAPDEDAEWLNSIGTGRLIDIKDAERLEAIASRLSADSNAVLVEALEWIEAFAQIRAADDSKTFARVNRGALRTIAERAGKALATVKQSTDREDPTNVG